MYQYQIDCENSMNKLFGHLEDLAPVFDRKDIFDAFEEADKTNSSYQPHLLSALKYNNCSTIKELLDKACACDLLLEYQGSYIAIDWTDNEAEVINKLEKHRWLSPIYEYLGIEYTLVVKATGYHRIRTKTHEMIARLKATEAVLKKIESMMDSSTVNGTLEFSIKTSL